MEFFVDIQFSFFPNDQFDFSYIQDVHLLLSQIGTTQGKFPNFRPKSLLKKNFFIIVGINYFLCFNNNGIIIPNSCRFMRLSFRNIGDTVIAHII